MSESILSLRKVSKSFHIHALDTHIKACSDISFEVGQGEFIGITGRSGSGKSTILKLIWRSYVPQQGEILYASGAFGRIDLCTLDDRGVLKLRRSEMGYVSQFLNVIPRTTAREAILQEALDAGLAREAAAEEAESLLQHFEIAPELRDSYVATFSGGEKLRLNIARAMVKKPRLLLLDEPTASLDQHSKLKVRELIERLKDAGTTMLGIFHDLEFMKDLCDREYPMAGGAMV